MKCMNDCGNELTGRQRTYCSDKCRKQAKRANSDAPDAVQSTNSDKEVSNYPLKSDTVRVTVKSDTFITGVPGDVDYDGCMEKVNGQWQQKVKPAIPLSEYSRQRLQLAIQSYPHDTWVNSPEYKELMRRLHSMSIEHLKAEGYWVPCWKRAEAAQVAAQAAN